MGDGLSPGDAAGIVRFRERGGGVLTARDHQDLGSSLSASARSAASTTSTPTTPSRDAQRDDQDNPDISWPNYHSGANGDYQPVFVVEPVTTCCDRPEGQRSHRVVPRPPARGIGRRRRNAVRAGRRPGRSTVTGRTSTWRSPSTARRPPTAAPGPRRGVLHVPPLRRHELGHRRRRAVVRDRPAATRSSAIPLGSTTFKDYVRNIARWLDESAGST